MPTCIYESCVPRGPGLSWFMKIFFYISFCSSSVFVLSLISFSSISPVATGYITVEELSPVAQLIIYICVVKMSKCLTCRKQRSGKTQPKGSVYWGDVSKRATSSHCNSRMQVVLVFLYKRKHLNKPYCIISGVDFLFAFL